MRDLENALDSAAAELAAAVGGMVAGSLRIERWAPGDGHARYRLMYRNADGIARECGPYHKGRGAMLDTLRTIQELAWRIAVDRGKAAERLREMRD